MMCHYCDQEREGLPFRCNYCGESFCGDHRLPENHACPRVGGPLQPGHARAVFPTRRSQRPRENQMLPSVKSGRSRFRIRYAGIFSEVERKHILLATAVMTAVGLSLSLSYDPFLFRQDAWLLVLLLPGFVFSFLGHEVAHKLLAQRNGLWAEFRTNTYGLMMTVVSVVFPIKFLAPGQTNIRGDGRKEILGAIALIGPGFNIALGLVFFILSRAVQFPASSAFLQLTVFNSWLAIFNLVPFGTFDGTRVFEWDKTRWVIAFSASIALAILGYYPALIWH